MGKTCGYETKVDNDTLTDGCQRNLLTNGKFKNDLWTFRKLKSNFHM